MEEQAGGELPTYAARLVDEAVGAASVARAAMTQAMDATMSAFAGASPTIDADSLALIASSWVLAVTDAQANVGAAAARVRQASGPPIWTDLPPAGRA
ncbi:hypothetical protein [Neoroseomonas rubea]|uniref:hypothetical protein n=1 Tax=Neoroseomonas rubea TaxID=2748666 RepID=UPI0018DF9C04|nr:hypothetical protein [Roseomonas rubea]